MATVRPLTAQLLPRLSGYAIDVFLYPRAWPRAVAKHHTIVQDEFLSWLQRVLFVEHERATRAGIRIVAHGPHQASVRLVAADQLAGNPGVRGRIKKQEVGTATGPVVEPDVSAPRGFLAHPLRSL